MTQDINSSEPLIPRDELDSMGKAKKSFDQLDEAKIKAILENLLDVANEHDITIAHDAAVKDED